jgi:hypothetical protein
MPYEAFPILSETRQCSTPPPANAMQQRARCDGATGSWYVDTWRNTLDDFEPLSWGKRPPLSYEMAVATSRSPFVRLKPDSMEALRQRTAVKPGYGIALDRAYVPVPGQTFAPDGSTRIEAHTEGQDLGRLAERYPAGPDNTQMRYQGLNFQQLGLQPVATRSAEPYRNPNRLPQARTSGGGRLAASEKKLTIYDNEIVTTMNADVAAARKAGRW